MKDIKGNAYMFSNAAVVLSLSLTLPAMVSSYLMVLLPLVPLTTRPRCTAKA